MFDCAEKVVRFDKYETEIGPLGGARLGHHTMDFHRRSVRNEIRCVARQLTDEQVWVDRVLDGAPKFRRHDDEESTLRPRNQAAFDGLATRLLASLGDKPVIDTTSAMVNVDWERS